MTTGQVIRKQRIKHGMYSILGRSMYFSGVTWLQNVTKTAPSLRILIYYKVNDLPGNTLSTAPQMFARQLCFLKEHYNIISPQHLSNVVAKGGTLPTKAVLLTFDDGYRDVYENAYPILKTMGLHALIFPATDYIGTNKTFPHDERLPMPNPALDWTQLRSMQDVFTVGSHTQSHRILTRLPLDVAKEEIFASKSVLEDQLGREVQFFCYPKGAAGQFSKRLEDLVQAAGYTSSFVTLSGPNTLEHVRSGRWLYRYHVEPFDDFMFARLLDGSCDAVGLKDTRCGDAARRMFNHLLGTATQ